MTREDTRSLLLAKLVRLIEEGGGDPTEIDLVAWLDAWLDEPSSELHGLTPAQALHSEAGRSRVEDLLERMRGGLPG